MECWRCNGTGLIPVARDLMARPAKEQREYEQHCEDLGQLPCPECSQPARGHTDMQPDEAVK